VDEGDLPDEEDDELPALTAEDDDSLRWMLVARSSSMLARCFYEIAIRFIVSTVISVSRGKQ
jgi:hypothetical protein